MNEHPVTVEFVTEESTADLYISGIKDSGGKLHGDAEPFNIPADLIDDYSDAQFEPLMLVAAAVAIGFIIKRVSDVWLDHTRPGGQVIDTRGDSVVIRVAPYLERGTLVLQTNEGVEVFHPQNHDETIPLLKEVILAHG